MTAGPTGEEEDEAEGVELFTGLKKRPDGDSFLLSHSGLAIDPFPEAM